MRPSPDRDRPRHGSAWSRSPTGRSWADTLRLENLTLQVGIRAQVRPPCENQQGAPEGAPCAGRSDFVHTGGMVTEKPERRSSATSPVATPGCGSLFAMSLAGWPRLVGRFSSSSSIRAGRIRADRGVTAKVLPQEFAAATSVVVQQTLLDVSAGGSAGRFGLIGHVEGTPVVARSRANSQEFFRASGRASSPSASAGWGRSRSTTDSSSRELGTNTVVPAECTSTAVG